MPAGPVSIGPGVSTMSIQASAQSASRGDTVINVRVGGMTTSFKLTAIRNPEIWFRGRFEARFATDGDYYNNPRGTDGGTPGSDPGLGPGWTWALEGEPNFVPVDSVPTTLDKPVGRVVRFNNPVALRPFVAPVSTAVVEILGATTSGTELFTTGDPIIGATVNLGPNTYLASNQPQNPADPAPAESNPAGFEPMALFECHIDGFFRALRHRWLIGRQRAGSTARSTPRKRRSPSSSIRAPARPRRFSTKVPLSNAGCKSSRRPLML